MESLKFNLTNFEFLSPSNNVYIGVIAGNKTIIGMSSFFLLFTDIYLTSFVLNRNNTLIFKLMLYKQ